MYTDRIPMELAKELQNKGYIAEIGPDDWDIVEAEWKIKESCYDTYADVLDWLYEMGVSITIMRMNADGPEQWLYLLGSIGLFEYGGNTMNEAMDTAIRKALKEIKI